LITGSFAVKASADTVDLSFLNVSPGQVESVSTNSGSTFSQENTGQFNFSAANKTGAAVTLIPGSTVASWCVELAQNVDPNSNTYTVLGPGVGPYVAPYTNTAAIAAFFNQFYSTSFTINQATAFQLDVWELEFDSSPGSLATGTFRVSGNDLAVQQGNTWLAAFNSATVGPWQIYQLHSATVQDQIFAVEGGGSGQNPTPLPPALAGGLLLITGLGVFARIRRHNPA
jgi:hypothetical protein